MTNQEICLTLFNTKIFCEVNIMGTIQIFGDSVLKGVIYDEEQQKYKLCKNNKFEIPGWDIHNNSRMGATIEDGLAMIERRLPVCNSDTLAVIELGGNDCNYNWEEISKRPDEHHFCKVEPEVFTAKLKQGIQRLQQTGATVVLTSLVPLYAPKFMNWITKGLSYDSILHWLGDVDHLFRWQDYYSEMVVETAQAMGCPLLDLRKEFLQTGYGERLCADGIHPTQIGHDSIHETVLTFFKQSEKMI